MLRRLIGTPFFWFSLMLTMGLFWTALRSVLPPADAAPYTVRDVMHPFDPDWPDVYLCLNQKCVGCHRPSTGQTDMTGYEALMAATTESGQRLVVPGRPEESPLWKQVAWNHSADPNSQLPGKPKMPENRMEWLTGGQQAAIRRWIENGALEYELPEHCSTRPLLEIDYPSAKECRACHPKQYTEWSRSMHAYAQHSPVFEAFNLTLTERTNGTIGTFCTRCHTPLGTSLGESGSRRNVHRSRLSMEGVTCSVCHRIARPYYKSSTRMAIQPGKLRKGCFYGPFDDPASDESDAHRSVGRNFLKSSAFCGSCHDVTIPEGTRLEEAFSEWQNSPAARQKVTCQHCHMGPIQGVPIPDDHRPLGRAASVPGIDPEEIPVRHLTDHTFAGPDYSLLPDTEFPYKLDWMYEVDYRDFKNLTRHQKQTLNALRRMNRRQLKIADAKRYELLQNAAEIYVHAPSTAEAGDRIKVRVDVLNKVAGHNFPTGFTAERQVWVEIVLFDPEGHVVFSSGDLDDNYDLRDEHSHAVLSGEISYDRHLMNFQSKFVALTNKGTERPVILPINRHLAPISILRPSPTIAASFGRPNTFRVSKGSLPPLARTDKKYPIRLPDCPGDYTLRIRLNYRHLPPHLFDKIGIPHLKHLIEVVVIDEHVSTLRVIPDR